MLELRSQIRAIIFGITGIIIAFLVFRIATDLINASSSNVLVSIINNISNILMSPFSGIVTIPNNILTYLNINAIVSIIFYVLGAILLSEILTAFLHDNVDIIIKNIVDIGFKFVEFMLILRVIFEFFGIDQTNPFFVKAVFALTSWSQGILFRIPIGLNSGFLDLSAIIALIIIVIIDAVIESFLSSVFRQIKSKKAEVSTNNNVSPVPQQTTFIQQPQQRPILPQQNIIINMPMPQDNNSGMSQNSAVPVHLQPIIIPVPQNNGLIQQSNTSYQPLPLNINPNNSLNSDPNNQQAKPANYIEGKTVE